MKHVVIYNLLALTQSRQGNARIDMAWALATFSFRSWCTAMVFSMTFCGLRVFQSQFIVLPTSVLLDWSRSATHVETMFFKDETAFVGCLFCSHVGDAFKLLSNAGEFALQSLDCNKCFALFGQTVPSLQFILRLLSINNSRSRSLLELAWDLGTLLGQTRRWTTPLFYYLFSDTLPLLMAG